MATQDNTATEVQQLLSTLQNLDLVEVKHNGVGGSFYVKKTILENACESIPYSDASNSTSGLKTLDLRDEDPKVVQLLVVWLCRRDIEVDTHIEEAWRSGTGWQALLVAAWDLGVRLEIAEFQKEVVRALWSDIEYNGTPDAGAIRAAYRLDTAEPLREILVGSFALHHECTDLEYLLVFGSLDTNTRFMLDLVTELSRGNDGRMERLEECVTRLQG